MNVAALCTALSRGQQTWQMRLSLTQSPTCPVSSQTADRNLPKRLSASCYAHNQTRVSDKPSSRVSCSQSGGDANRRPGGNCASSFAVCNYDNCIMACGPGSSVGIATELRAGRSQDRIPVGRDFPPIQTDSGAHLDSCTMGTGSFPGVKSGRGVTLITHPLLVPRSWNRVELYLYPPSGPVTGTLYPHCIMA